MHLVVHCNLKAGLTTLGMTSTVLLCAFGVIVFCSHVASHDGRGEVWTGFMQLLHRYTETGSDAECNSSAISCRHNVMLRPNIDIGHSIWHSCRGQAFHQQTCWLFNIKKRALVFWCWARNQLQCYEDLCDILLNTLTAIERPSRPLWHYVELPENNRYCSLSAKSCPFIKTLPASLPSILSACLPSRNTRRVGRACRQHHGFVNNAT